MVGSSISMFVASSLVSIPERWSGFKFDLIGHSRKIQILEIIESIGIHDHGAEVFS